VTKKKAIERAYEILKKIEDEPIRKVLAVADNIIQPNVVRAVESKNPLDYDGIVQKTQIYLPNSKRIIGYVKDTRFVLVRYDVGDTTLGSAIRYREGNTLLVDAVEGNEKFRKDEIFEVVYRDLVERAIEGGAEKIVFNIEVDTETLRKFVEFLGRKGLKEGRVKMNLETEAYLRAKKVKERLPMESTDMILTW